MPPKKTGTGAAKKASTASHASYSGMLTRIFPPAPHDRRTASGGFLSFSPVANAYMIDMIKEAIINVSCISPPAQTADSLWCRNCDEPSPR